MDNIKTKDRQSIFLMDNQIMNYSWGTTNFIAELTGITNTQQLPQAELWMGAHPKAPSVISYNNQRISLAEFIAKDPHQILGKELADKYQRLPFLFKVLSAAQPLSIQVHPDLLQAKQGFAEEEAMQLPLDAKVRNYKDQNHKPEMLLALTPFYALSGIRQYQEISEFIRFLRLDDKIDEFNYLAANISTDVLKDFFLWILNLKNRSREKVRTNILRAALLRSGCDHPAAEAVKWICKIDKFFPSDIGIFAPLVMNTILLHPGEAIYMDAGILHAYLQGSGLEIMANSDNVLRCGLTPKHVDTAQLMKIARFSALEPHFIRPQMRKGREIYHSLAPEFLLSKINIIDSYRINDLRSPQIILCTKGAVSLKSTHGELLSLNKGQSAFISAAADSCQIKGNAELYLATVNS